MKTFLCFLSVLSLALCMCVSVNVMEVVLECTSKTLFSVSSYCSNACDKGSQIVKELFFYNGYSVQNGLFFFFPIALQTLIGLCDFFCQHIVGIACGLPLC